MELKLADAMIAGRTKRKIFLVGDKLKTVTQKIIQFKLIASYLISATKLAFTAILALVLVLQNTANGLI